MILLLLLLQGNPSQVSQLSHLLKIFSKEETIYHLHSFGDLLDVGDGFQFDSDIFESCLLWCGQTEVTYSTFHALS